MAAAQAWQLNLYNTYPASPVYPHPLCATSLPYSNPPRVGRRITRYLAWRVVALSFCVISSRLARPTHRLCNNSGTSDSGKHVKPTRWGAQEECNSGAHFFSTCVTERVPLINPLSHMLIWSMALRELSVRLGKLDHVTCCGYTARRRHVHRYGTLTSLGPNERDNLGQRQERKWLCIGNTSSWSFPTFRVL